MQSKQRDQILNNLKEIIIKTLNEVPVRVYLFGSWARGDEKRSSDIDIAVLSNEGMSLAKWVELREKIDESYLPYKVDLVDLSKANPVFLEKVMKEGILWKDYSNGSNLHAKH